MRELDHIKKILVRAPNWIGDAVMAVPALSALRVRFPEAEMTLLAKPPVAALFERHPIVDRLWLFKDPGEHAGLSGRWRLSQSLKREHFDLAFLLQNAFEAAAVAWMAGIGERVGYAADGRGFLLTRALSRRGAPRHQREAYSNLVTLVGGTAERAAPYLLVTAREREEAQAILRSYGISGPAPLLGLNPGAAYGPSKRWAPRRFAEVADRLAERFGAEVIIFGGAKEAALADQIGREMKHPAVSLAGKTTVREMMALISQLQLFITNDSGPMHIASALGVPLVSIFGPTDPTATAPGGAAFSIVQNEVDCAPCKYRECPIDHRCMERVSVDEVFAAAQELIGQGIENEAALRAGESENKSLLPVAGSLQKKRIAVFLDRDGTINVDTGHLDSVEKFSLIPGAAEATAELSRRGIVTILVTNQSGIVRGLFTETLLDEVHRRLQLLLVRKGGHLDGIYHCPHHPEFVACDCRKPAMGMVERAIEAYGIDLSRSYVVGDREIDMGLAKRGAKGILVQTGYGKQSLQAMTEAGKRPAHVAPDLAGAVAWILDDLQKRERALGAAFARQTLSEPDRSPRIALVKLGSIGDCVHMLPLIPALRKSFPKAYVAWIVEEKSKEIPAGQHGIDEVIVVDTRLWRRLLKGGKIGFAYHTFRALRKRLLARKFDFAIDGQGLVKSGLITWATGAPVRIGFSWKGAREGWNTFFTTRRISPEGAHVVEQNLSLLKGLGISERAISFEWTDPDGAVKRVADWRRKAGVDPTAPLVALHPGAGFKTKEWPLESFVLLADRLRKEGIQVVITSAGERSEEMESLLNGKEGRPLIAPPLSLKELAALYRSCRAVVAGDTGPLHIAAAVGAPTVGLFGPSEASRSASLGIASRAVQSVCLCRGDGPYFPRACRQKVSCIEQISVDDVFRKVQELLEATPAKGN